MTTARVSRLSAEVAYGPAGPAEVSDLFAELGYAISYADAEAASVSTEVGYSVGGTAQVSSAFVELGFIGLASAQVASLFAETAYTPVGTAQVASLFAEIARSVTLQTPLALTAISPAFGWVDGGEAVTLTGDGFAAGARVTFGGSPATSVVVVNANTITCLAPAHDGGAVTVTVRLLDGRSDSLVNGFTYFREPGYVCQDRFPAQEPLS